MKPVERADGRAWLLGIAVFLAVGSLLKLMGWFSGGGYGLIALGAGIMAGRTAGEVWKKSSCPICKSEALQPRQESQ